MKQWLKSTCHAFTLVGALGGMMSPGNASEDGAGDFGESYLLPPTGISARFEDASGLETHLMLTMREKYWRVEVRRGGDAWQADACHKERVVSIERIAMFRTSEAPRANDGGRAIYSGEYFQIRFGVLGEPYRIVDMTVKPLSDGTLRVDCVWDDF